MKLDRRKRLSFLETCSANDMAFLLIIYFIVIAGFNINTGFLMNLPAKDSTRLILREELLRFEMDEEDTITYDGQPVDFEETQKIISSALAGNPNIAVLLTINRNTRWQRVVSFVEVAQALQIDSFSFAMQKEF